MVIIANRMLRTAPAGESIAIDDIGRVLSPAQRASMVERLSGDVAERMAALVETARGEVATLRADAAAEVATIREQARAEGYAEGRAAGEAEGYSAGCERASAEMDPLAALLRSAAENAETVRITLLEGVEAQAVDLALAAASRVVGSAAESHALLAAAVVREGIRTAGGRTLRVRVHPDHAPSVSAALLATGKDIPIHPDAAIEIGGCIIDVEHGMIDLRLSTQLESIARAFGHNGP